MNAAQRPVGGPGAVAYIADYFTKKNLRKRLKRDEAEKERVRRAAGAECQIVVDSERALVMHDPYGVRWELNTFAYDDPPRLSTGFRRGHWLEIEPRGG